MSKTYDFSAGQRGAVVAPPSGQTRIALPLDDDVIEWFRAQVNDAHGGDWRALVNAALREHIRRRAEGPLEDTLRRVIREELRAVG